MYTCMKVSIMVTALLLAGCGSRSTGDDDGGTTADLPKTKKDKGPRKDGKVIRKDGKVISDKGLVDSMILPDVPFQPNGKCADAIALTMVAGKAMAQGDTSKFANEYGTSINCQSYGTVMRGRQQYYKVPLKAGQAYLFSLKSQYNYARFYIFSGCGAATINKDCGSNGATGAVSNQANNGQTRTVLFKPAKAGTYHVAVDSTRNNGAGKFTLTVEQYKQATNTTCAKATVLTVPAGGKVTVSSTTAGAKDEFSSITCGSSYTMNGPQVYYKVLMSAGKTYRVSWTPEFTYSRVYVFGTTCSATSLQKDCSSKGASGAYSGPTASGQENTITFKPKTKGYYTIAIDSRVSSYSGKFKLTVEDWVQAVNSTCAKAKKLTLTSGKVTVKGNTYGAKNEFGKAIRCGTTSDFDGAQLYYSVDLKAGKNYRMTLTPGFSARLYAFASSCNALGINAACASKGVTGHVTSTISAGSTGSFVLKPSGSATYRVAVDSPYDYASGSFSLLIEEYTPPQNGACKKAQLLKLSGGKVSVTADTTGMANDFGTSINCGYYNGAFDGPQVYYYISLTKGQSYVVRLNPKFLSRYYIARSTCDATKINKDCSSGGASGAYATVSANGAGSILFTPSATGNYHIAVDSQNPVYYGKFTLSVETYTPPTHAKCASAKAVTLGSGTTKITGDTKYVPNEFGTAINCGSYSTSNILMGSQLYYKVTLTAGKSYTFSFTPYYSYGRVYVFTNSCTYTTINTDCGSQGKTGFISSSTSSGNTTTVTFKPKVSGTYKVAVDSTRTLTSAAGSFTLEIK